MTGAPRSSAATHVGAVRRRNEDNLVARPDLGLWAVADGAGGHGAGDVASGAIADGLNAIPAGLSAAEILAQVRLRLDAVHRSLHQAAASRGPGAVVASTVVILILRGGHFATLWAGDSRLYLLRDGALLRVTTDHSVVQELIEAGTLAPDAAEHHPHANVITRAVGQEGALLLDKVADRVQPGDRFLLCSDGIFKELPEPALAGLLRDGADAPAIVDAALAAGARDNISAVLVAP
jgi:serine/threonine protein phosphatase PrpC